ncbi:MAG: hypothetical protein K8I30_19640 [Anaerolineae bacterium]|nr:hypothetical protein [Anaerolineae bacterium]
MSEPQKPPLITYTLPPRRSRLRRFGCTVALILWFMILLTPCFCFVLASQGEINIQLGDLPGQSLRIWLLNESRQRGIGISRPAVFSSESSDGVCMQTDVSFILWAGTADASTFCECFDQSASMTWEVVSGQPGDCPP